MKHPLDIQIMTEFPYNSPLFFYSRGHHTKSDFVKQLKEKYPVDYADYISRYSYDGVLMNHIRREYWRFIPYYQDVEDEDGERQLRYRAIKEQKGKQGVIPITVLLYN